MRALFLADWLNVVFMHFRADADALQKIVPLELHCFDGQAFISLVAFTQSRLRFARGGRWLEPLTAPLARHEFFNVRTYVRHGQVRGIYFLAEWIPNRLAVLAGPRVYGLPYRLGRLRYRNEAHREVLSGRVSAGGESVLYEAKAQATELGCARRDSLEEFLLERYTAFTCRNDVIRRFDVAHEPWRHVPVEVKLNLHACAFAAHYSPGVRDVAITPPRRVPSPAARSSSPPGAAAELR